MSALLDMYQQKSWGSSVCGVASKAVPRLGFRGEGGWAGIRWDRVGHPVLSLKGREPCGWESIRAHGLACALASALLVSSLLWTPISSFPYF